MSSRGVVKLTIKTKSCSCVSQYVGARSRSFAVDLVLATPTRWQREATELFQRSVNRVTVVTLWVDAASAPRPMSPAMELAARRPRPLVCTRGVLPTFATIEAAQVRESKAQGIGASEIAKRLKIGRASVYRVLGA
jgi:hypothetical protein